MSCDYDLGANRPEPKSERLVFLLKTLKRILKNELQLSVLTSEEKGKLCKLIRKELKDAKP